MRIATLVALCSLLLSSPAFSQNILSDAPSPASSSFSQSLLPNAPSPAIRTRFWDKTQKKLFAANLAAETLDAITTQRFLSRHAGVELNPLAKPLVTQGWAGQVAFSYGFNTAGLLLVQYVAHKRNWNRVDRVMGIGQASSAGIMGIANFRLWNAPPMRTYIPYQQCINTPGCVVLP